MLLTTTSKINAIKEFMRAGDYDSAVQIAEKVNPERVNSVRDLMTIANAYLKKHRYDDAKVVYVEMHNHATTHKVMVGLIELCLKTNCPEEAEVYIREFRKLEPTNPERLIYRYRVDVMLEKGPEYLVKSLSKLKDEDYSDVWGLELAKTYYKMEDYQNCAQECKDLLLWFSGTEAAAKAHILLTACIEKGAKISMPEVKPRREEDFSEEAEQEETGVPTIIPEPKKEESEDNLFFDVSAVIDELDTNEQADVQNEDSDTVIAVTEDGTVSEASVSESNNANDEGFYEDPDETFFEEKDDTFFEEEKYTKENPSAIESRSALESRSSVEGQPAEVSQASVEARSAVDMQSAEVKAQVVTNYSDNVEEDIPEDATELLSFLSDYSDEEISEALKEAELTLPEDATVPIFLPKEGEQKAPEVQIEEQEFDLIGLAVRKAKESDDDEDDIVIRDYFPKDILEKAIAKANSAKNVNAADSVKKTGSAESAVKATPADSAKKANTAEPAVKASTAEAGSGVQLKVSVPVTTPASDTEKDAAVGAHTQPKNTEKPQKPSISESFEQALAAEEEESDGQMSFFGSMKDQDDVKLSFGKSDTNDEESFDDLAFSIAQAVEDEMKNGTPESDSVSTEPTKVHEDITAEALDAMLREDDEAVEKALYELLSDNA